MLQTDLAVKKRGLKVGQTRMDKTFDIMNYVLLTICFLVVAYPLYFVVIASVSDPVDVNAGRVILYPVRTTLDGYRRILEYKSFFTGYRNTLVYTGVGTLVNMLLTVPAAYALSRKDLVGRNVFMMMIAFTMIFSAGINFAAASPIPLPPPVITQTSAILLILPSSFSLPLRYRLPARL